MAVLRALKLRQILKIVLSQTFLSFPFKSKIILVVWELLVGQLSKSGSDIYVTTFINIIYNTIIAFEKRLKNILKEVVLMTTQIINNFNSLNSEDLSTVKGGACHGFQGATAAVGVGGWRSREVVFKQVLGRCGNKGY